MLDSLPLAKEVIDELEGVLGEDDSMSVHDHGHGYGAVHVTVAHWASTSARWFQQHRADWAYEGPAMVAVTPGEEVPVINWVEWSRRVRIGENA